MARQESGSDSFRTNMPRFCGGNFWRRMGLPRRFQQPIDRLNVARFHVVGDVSLKDQFPQRNRHPKWRSAFLVTAIDSLKAPPQSDHCNTVFLIADKRTWSHDRDFEPGFPSLSTRTSRCGKGKLMPDA